MRTTLSRRPPRERKPRRSGGSDAANQKDHGTNKPTSTILNPSETTAQADGWITRRNYARLGPNSGARRQHDPGTA